MDKINCIEDYFSGIRAYYLFKLGKFYNNLEYMSFILDKININASKIVFLSNIMLAIKEDLVDTKGAMNYQSKVFINSLEESVSFVATKVENGYKIGNYVFPNASTLVAIVRNKLAHGKYKMDLDHNRVILEHKGVDIVINIDKLINFILMAFRNTMRDNRNKKYERNFVYIKNNNVSRTYKIKKLSEVKSIIRNYYYLCFEIESLNDFPVPYDCILLFESFLKDFGIDGYLYLKGDRYKELVKYLNKRNCKISYECKNLSNDNEINRILNFADNEIIGNENLDYNQQLRLIGFEVQKSINNKQNTFNAIAANVHNLIELSAISKMNSVDNNDISSYIANHYVDEIKSGYDEYGMILIGMFNSLFIYPYDDVFETNGEYKLDRSSGFDFSKLDLSMIKPLIINIDDSGLRNIEDRYNSLLKKQDDISKKIEVQNNNLLKVKGNIVAEANINKGIKDLQISLANIISEFVNVNGEYNMIKNDYIINRLYFENRAIIEGIRNSIAHGNYEFIVNGNFFDTKIIFKDIYEGKNTFQLEISFKDFEDMINNNYDIVLEFVRNKINGKSR